ncbi:MAG: immunity 8 family protein [Pseudomonadota bacterium]
MRGKVRYFSMVGGEFSEYWPDDVTNFCIGADATIGPENGIGGEIFSFQVCSPKWFSENESHSPVFARHIIFMNEYDEPGFMKIVEDLVANTHGETWHEVALKLSRYMFWEFEDYQEYVPESG